MSDKPRVLAFAGSTREGSYNQKLIRVAAVAAEAAGAEVTLLDLREYPLPPYSAELEASNGLPEAATRLKAVFAAHDALLVACPDHNKLVTPLLKTTLDWLARPAPGEEPRACL